MSLDLSQVAAQITGLAARLKTEDKGRFERLDRALRLLQTIDIDALVIKNVIADQGPSLKRFRARARGRATRILKRTSHITVILED